MAGHFCFAKVRTRCCAEAAATRTSLKPQLSEPHSEYRVRDAARMEPSFYKEIARYLANVVVHQMASTSALSVELRLNGSANSVGISDKFNAIVSSAEC